MKISDFVHQMYRHKNEQPDVFRVRIFVNRYLEIFALVTDLNDKRIGTSITNIIEDIHKDLITQGYIDENSQIIEHYEKPYFKEQTFDLVKHGKNQNTTWQTLTIDNICRLLECNMSEFHIDSLSLQPIHLKLEKIRHRVSPFIDEPISEPSAVLIRREEIQKNQISKSNLQQIINREANETEIHQLINADLSILGDYFSNPKEEYICFSEFPLEGEHKDGSIDFVVFSGRSRMDVTLIEIKGADFNLITQNSYQNFSAKANEGIQQLRSRTKCIYRKEEHFRKLFHDIRKKVEKGKPMYRSFIGAKGKLLVDPNKDINIHRVFIGGRSINDIEESRLRHEYEHGQSPSIKIESWDSFLNKLDRD